MTLRTRKVRDDNTIAIPTQTSTSPSHSPNRDGFSFSSSHAAIAMMAGLRPSKG